MMKENANYLFNYIPVSTSFIIVLTYWAHRCGTDPFLAGFRFLKFFKFVCPRLKMLLQWLYEVHIRKARIRFLSKTPGSVWPPENAGLIFDKIFLVEGGVGNRLPQLTHSQQLILFHVYYHLKQYLNFKII